MGERTLKVKKPPCPPWLCKRHGGHDGRGGLGEIHPPTFGKPPLGAAREGLKAPGWGRGHQQRASKFW